MTTIKPVMKTNTYLLLTLISGTVAWTLGAGAIAEFAVLVAAGVLGLALHDYTRIRSVKFRALA